MQDAPRYITPGLAADKLSASPSGLRRLAKIYEEVHGELPRDGTGGRFWTDEAIERLEAAKALVESSRYRSIKAALEALQEGVEAPSEALAKDEPQPDMMRLLLDELRALRMSNETLHQELAGMNERMRALEAPTANPGANPSDEPLVSDLERRNAYLEGELKRRDEQPAPRRAWWRVWG
jgi:hypothetical protein